MDTVILGLGETGLSCAKFLYARGERFAVTDDRKQPPNLERLDAACPGTPVAAGGFDARLIASARRLLVSPGISLEEPAVRAAQVKGTEIIGDIELFARHADAPVVAITGSNGKSTVTALTGEMARHAGVVARVGGNIGTPALDLLGDEAPQFYVLELSSFQLETTSSLRPLAATVLNVSPDHMDRYGDVHAYATAKQRIFSGAAAAVVNVEDSLVTGMVPAVMPRTFKFTTRSPGDGEFGLVNARGETWLACAQELLLPVNELKIKGVHNAANALAALALGTVMELPMVAMLDALRHFPGLPHRCQWLGEKDGINWYNDSKGTNVGATCAAVRGIGQARDVVLIAGGMGKGATFAELAEVAHRLRCAVVFGQDADKLAAVLSGFVPVFFAGSLPDAVAQARRNAGSGDSILFSPACASFDMFANYQERGERFMQAVRAELA